MSQLAVALITDLAGTGSPNIKSGELSRMRINFNGTGTVAIRDSFNVSSLVDNGTGDYSFNYSVSAPNADSSVATSGQLNAGFAATQQTVLAARVFTVSSAGTNTDAVTVSAIIAGDKP